MNRRHSLRLAFGACAFPSLSRAAAERNVSPFPFHGYYVTFMRMPAMGLAEWKEAVDRFAEDGANTLVLWMPGGFRSRKFPLTWKYNGDHPNVQKDFARDLIDHARSRGIRVLLGFTPFGYDGVNQMPREHPDWKARKADGSPVDEFGIHSWGWSLCPARPGARDFMREYLREMIFEFYPNADGLMVESSDYNVCRCPECQARPYEEEFRLTREISEEVWRANSEALILVYPHFFTGREVPGLETAAAAQPFDPRWGLFFTPHSAHLDANLIRKAKCSFYSGPEAALGTPAAVLDAVRTAREHGANGYLPSLEAFSYMVTRPEGGDPYFNNKRRRPLGLDPGKEGRMPYASLPARVQRLAVREFSADPGLTLAGFSEKAEAAFFPGGESARETADLLALQRIWNHEADWYWASPLLDPAFFKARAKRLQWPAEKLAGYQRNLETLREIAARHSGSKWPAAREMARLAAEVTGRWGKENPAEING